MSVIPNKNQLWGDLRASLEKNDAQALFQTLDILISHVDLDVITSYLERSCITIDQDLNLENTLFVSALIHQRGLFDASDFLNGLIVDWPFFRYIKMYQYDMDVFGKATQWLTALELISKSTDAINTEYVRSFRVMSFLESEWSDYESLNAIQAFLQSFIIHDCGSECEALLPLCLGLVDIVKNSLRDDVKIMIISSMYICVCELFEITRFNNKSNASTTLGKNKHLFNVNDADFYICLYLFTFIACLEETASSETVQLWIKMSKSLLFWEENSFQVSNKIYTPTHTYFIGDFDTATKILTWCNQK